MGLLAVSIITCAVLYGLLAIVLAAACLSVGLPVYGAIAIVVVVVVIQFLIAPWLTDLTQKWFYHTKFDAEVPAYLSEFIDEVCASQNMKRPRIGYIDDGAPNAFTYGRTKNDARVVLTRGIFELLDEDEVKAVVAHELGHAVHYDMALMTMVQIVPMVLYIVARTTLQATRGSSGGNKNNNNGAFIVAAIAFVLYVVSEYVILWLSRVREYYADEFSAQVTNNPNALASALVNIGFGLSTRAQTKKSRGSASSQSTLGIFDTRHSKSLVVECYEDGKINPSRITNAMKWERWNTWAFWYEFGSTHPLTSKRLLRLGEMAQAQGQEALVNFDLQKPQSYVGSFILELFVCVLPWIGFLGLFVGGILVGRQTNFESGPWPLMLAGSFVAGFALSCVKYLFTHPRKGYFEANTAGLLGEVSVSMVRSIPAQLTGTIIGRGNPGCIFDENFVLRDKTGILFLDYNQPLWIINKVFAMFRSAEYFDKPVTVRGWYRRSMVPFFELYSMEVDGQTKKCYSYGFGWGWRLVLLALSIVLFAIVLL